MLPNPMARRLRSQTVPRIVAVCGLALVAMSTHAETWIDVPSATASDLLQWDRDSVSTTGGERPTLTWRVGSTASTGSTGTPGRATLYRGTVDCQAVSVRIDSATDVDARGRSAADSGASVDYGAGTRTWQGQVNRLTDGERAAGQEFPVPGNRAARLIRSVCATRVDGSHAADSAPVHSATPADLDQPALLALRLRQATDACRLDGPRADRLATAWQALPAECDSTMRQAFCGPAAADAALAGLGADLGRAAAGLACVYVPQTLADAADGAAERAARDRFQACASRVIPQLDDRLSQADVVAKGVFGACRGELPASVAQGQSFENGLLPGLTAAVLAHRSGGRRAVLPTKPTRTEAR